MTQTIAIIDYEAGNLKSAAKAFERAAQTLANPPHILVTNAPEIVARADRVVLPGVGAFADCYQGLEAIYGMHDALTERVLRDGVPFLGICVGMQLLASIGREKGAHKGLGWIEGAVEKITPADPNLKVPHMGWNTINLVHNHPLFAGIPTGPDGLHAYFVHSYHFVAENQQDVIARADYGGPVTAAIGRDNVIGVQFHPEKSQKLGLALIHNFLEWRP